MTTKGPKGLKMAKKIQLHPWLAEFWAKTGKYVFCVI
jgi:hypothetical protein